VPKNYEQELDRHEQPIGGVIVGLPESPIENVLLENITITAEPAGLELRNASGVKLKNVKVTAKRGEPILVRNAEVSGLSPAK